MTRRKALTIALSVAGLSGLIFVLLLLLSKPEPADLPRELRVEAGLPLRRPDHHAAKPTTTTTAKKVDHDHGQEGHHHHGQGHDHDHQEGRPRPPRPPRRSRRRPQSTADQVRRPPRPSTSKTKKPSTTTSERRRRARARDDARRGPKPLAMVAAIRGLHPGGGDGSSGDGSSSGICRRRVGGGRTLRTASLLLQPGRHRLPAACTGSASLSTAPSG